MVLEFRHFPRPKQRTKEFHNEKISLLTLLVFTLISSNAFAKKSFKSSIPNVETKNCATCHTGEPKDKTWNVFGTGIKNSLKNEEPDWPRACSEDFDGDGASNGVELGDPDCMFPDMDAGAYVSDPADKDSKPPMKPGTNNGTNNGTNTGGMTNATNNKPGKTSGMTATNGQTPKPAKTNNGTSGNNETTPNGDEDNGGCYCSSANNSPGEGLFFLLLGAFFFVGKRRRA